MKLYSKYLIFIIVLILSLSSAELISQPKHMRERIRTMKKIKLIEVLDLEEDILDKFIVKYSLVEKKKEKQIREFDLIEEKLRISLKEESNEEIAKFISKFEQAKDELFKIDTEKVQMARKLLSDKEYAKFLIFEKIFNQELTKKIFKDRMGKNKQGRKRR